MVNEQQQDSGRRPANQGVRDVVPEPNKINASTPYDFNGKNLTPYGGLLPVITMLEKLGFRNTKDIPDLNGAHFALADERQDLGEADFEMIGYFFRGEIVLHLVSSL